MPFPVRVGELTVPHAAGLAVVVMADALRGGGTVVADQGTVQWVSDMVTDGRVSDEEVHGLVRALLLRKEPEALLLGSWLCKALSLTRAGPWLLAALKDGDLGALLARDPASGHTVEGALGSAAAQCSRWELDTSREIVLAALRSVGASVEEAQLLARDGSVQDVLRWGPALVEGGDPAVRAALEVGLERPVIADAVEDLLDPW